MIDQVNVYFQYLMQLFIILGSITYLIFALIVLKQTTTMTRNVYDKFNSILVAFSYVHLFFSALLVILTLTL